MQPPCSLASPIARRAYAAAISGAPFTIEMLTIAAVCALLIGPTEKAAVVVVLFLIGELLEGLAAQRARASIKSLATLARKTAWVEADGSVDARKLFLGSPPASDGHGKLDDEAKCEDHSAAGARQDCLGTGGGWRRFRSRRYPRRTA